MIKIWEVGEWIIVYVLDVWAGGCGVVMFKGRKRDISQLKERNTAFLYIGWGPITLEMMDLFYSVYSFRYWSDRNSSPNREKEGAGGEWEKGSRERRREEAEKTNKDIKGEKERDGVIQHALIRKRCGCYSWPWEESRRREKELNSKKAIGK